jgi:hypothetical protein
MIICLFLIVLLNACSSLPDPITGLKKEDIKKYGISYEAEKILQLGIEVITAIGIYHLRHLLYHTRTKNLPGCANSLPIKTPPNTIIVMWRSFLI